MSLSQLSYSRSSFPCLGHGPSHNKSTLRCQMMGKGQMNGNGGAGEGKICLKPKAEISPFLCPSALQDCPLTFA